MTGLIRREPWSLLNQLHSEMDKLFEHRGLATEAESATDWVPAVDITEEKDRYVLHADIPGVDPKEIELTMERGVLTIKGERKHQKNEAGQGYHRSERVSGTFYRRFNLPDIVETGAITAKGVNGVLEVVIPKTARPAARKIAIES